MRPKRDKQSAEAAREQYEKKSKSSGGYMYNETKYRVVEYKRVHDKKTPAKPKKKK